MTKNDSVIRVRDRRTPQQFTIHNRVIDEWFPIIGMQGLALYCLYCRMANKEDERCWPSYRMIAKHMRMGQSTISDYNKLLVWCGLIHIEEGDPLTNTPNEYYILDIPEVTDEALASIKTAVSEDLQRLAEERNKTAKKLEDGGLEREAKKTRQKGPGSFFTSLLKRLDNWKPIQEYWAIGVKNKPQVAKPGQMSLFDPAPGGEHPAPGGEHPAPDGEHPAPGGEHPAPDGEHPAPDGEHPAPDGEYPAPDGEYPAPDGEYPAPRSGAEQSITTIHNNNPKQQSITTTPTATTVTPVNGTHAAVDVGVAISSLILDWMGFNGRLTSKDNNPSPAMLLAWAYWVRVQGSELKEQGKNAVGIARAGWRRGDIPSSGFFDLAQTWLATGDDVRQELFENAGRRTRLLEESGVTPSMCDAFRKVYEATNGEVAPSDLLSWKGDD